MKNSKQRRIKRTCGLMTGWLVVLFMPAVSWDTALAQETAGWVARYNGPANGIDRVAAMAVDASGNVYVTGSSEAAVVINGVSYRIPDYATIKYDADGKELWAARYNGPRNDYESARAMAVDASGNVYVTGTSYGSGTGFDYATVKYDANGNQLWVARYNGPGNGFGGTSNNGDSAYAIAVNASGNVYVTGSSIGPGFYDYATIKYDTDGNQLWVARYNGPVGAGEDHANALAVDASGNVYVTGSSDPGAPSDSSDYATVKYDANGNELWVARYDGPGDQTGYNPDSARALAVDASGNVYVTGSSIGPGYYDYATVKYDADGNELWVARYDGPANSYDSAQALAVDAYGNVYVTGASYGLDDPRDYTGANTDYATVKYNADGNPLWVARYDNKVYPNIVDQTDNATALAVDASGNVYVTGESVGSSGYSEYATIKYDPNGSRLWELRYNVSGDNDDVATALAVDASGNVHVAGNSTGSNIYSDYVTIKYNASSRVDFVTTAVGGPTSGVVGQDIIISDTVKNQGTESTIFGFSVGLYLSSDEAITTSDIRIGTRWVAAPAPGESSSGSRTVTIPPGVPSGTYFIGALADDPGQTLESDETNNGLAGNTITVSGPDLIITAVIPNAASVNSGSLLSVTTTVKNQGTSPGSFKVGFQLSTTRSSIFPSYVGPMGIPTTLSVYLAAGASNTITAHVAISKDMWAGNFYVCAKADPEHHVAESDERNNILCSSVQVTVPPPDLAITSVATTATAVAPGATLTFSNTVKNQGGSLVTPWYILAYLSTGIGSDKIGLFSFYSNLYSLGPGISISETYHFPVPSTVPAGDYYLCARGTIEAPVPGGEGNYDNNTGCTVSTIRVGFPDLTVTDVTPNAATVNAGAMLSVTNTVQNQGTISSGSFTVAFRLSPNTIYGDADDVAITTTRSVSSLAAGASNTATTSLTIPSTTIAGSYYVCAKADSGNSNAEMDETNNTLCSTSQVVVPPADLVMTTVSTTATIVAPGKTFALSNTVRNQGGSSAGSFVIAFHLSSDAVYGGTDDIAFTVTRTVASLGVGASSTGSTTLTVPLTTPVGDYHVCVIADTGGAVAEGDEANNSHCTASTVQVTRPDLIMTGVTPNAASVNAGATLSVTDTVKNQGLLAAGSSRVGYRLSFNTIYGDADDVAITTIRSVTTLAAGVTSSGTVSLTIPSTTKGGGYYVCAKADSAAAVAETDENNNTLCSTSQVTVPPPDLILTALSTTATSVRVGATFSLSSTVKNQGGSRAGAFAVGFVLSPNSTIGDSDDLLLSPQRSVTSLGVGASSTGSTTVTVPAGTPAGSYNIGAMADVNRTVAEGSEGNNTILKTGTITVTP